MRRATLSEMGIGLVSRPDAINDIRPGELVAPLGLDALEDLTSDCVTGFYLVLPKAQRCIANIDKICEWITAENWVEVPNSSLSNKMEHQRQGG